MLITTSSNTIVDRRLELVGSPNVVCWLSVVVLNETLTSLNFSTAVLNATCMKTSLT